MRAPTWLPMPVRRALRVLRRYFRVLVRRFEHWSAPARRQWRRSLQLRIVALTLVASSVLVGAFGFFVAQNSARILLNRAQDEVQSSLQSKTKWAESQLSVYFNVGPGVPDPKLPEAMSQTVTALADDDPAESGGSIVTMRADQFPNLKPVTSTK